MRALESIEEVYRYYCLRMLLSPAARCLPRSLARGIAQVIAASLVMSPATGPRVYWQFRRAFGMGRLRSLALVRRWIARGFLDFVMAQRIVACREQPEHWSVVQLHAERMAALRESGRSYIVAGGHFMMWAGSALYGPSACAGAPHRVTRVAGGRKTATTWKDRRVSYQGNTYLKAAGVCWNRKVGFISVGSDLGTARTMLRKLTEPGNVLFIDVDLYMPTESQGCYHRPLAGHRSWRLATGVAQLARMTGCPVVSCVHHTRADGTIVIEWGEPMMAEHKSADGDIEFVNRLIAPIEVAIGRRPAQYCFEIGSDRSWCPETETWS